MKESLTTCDICGKKGARVKKTTRSYGRGKDLLIVENIPVITCPSCGESYLEAQTLHEIERLRLHRKHLAERRSIEVVNYA